MISASWEELLVECRRWNSEVAAEHGSESALACVTAIKSDIDDTVAVCYALEGEQKAGLFAPMREAHSGLLREKPMYGFRCQIEANAPFGRR